MIFWHAAHKHDASSCTQPTTLTRSHLVPTTTFFNAPLFEFWIFPLIWTSLPFSLFSFFALFHTRFLKLSLKGVLLLRFHRGSICLPHRGGFREGERPLVTKYTGEKKGRGKGLCREAE